MKHLTDIKALSLADIQRIFSTADTLATTPNKDSQTWHQGKSAMALFFENSTRTLTSFQLACQRLGVDCTALNVAHSSTQKGESLFDTMATLNAMQTDCFIVRHHQNQMPEQMLERLGGQTSVINAGDGTNQHPTQGLLDLYTIRQHKEDFGSLKITLIGDIKHSRVANSLLDGLATVGTQNICLFAPDELIPAERKSLQAESMQSALADCDVVVMLRIQKERLPAEFEINFDDWHRCYGLDQAKLGWAKSDAIVMHPGPINRGVEITDDVADGSQSVILNQVTNGVLIRQALMHHILSEV